MIQGLNLPIWVTQKRNRTWRVMMDYYKVDQVVTPVAVLYQMWFHCLSKLTYPWCLQQMPFSLLVNKAHQKQFVFVFTW
jgi:hypothetical protein